MTQMTQKNHGCCAHAFAEIDAVLAIMGKGVKKTSHQELFATQAKMIGAGLLAWLVLSGILYVMGAAVGWVFRGFFPKRGP